MDKAGVSKFCWGDRVRIVKNIIDTEDIEGTCGILKPMDKNTGFAHAEPEIDNTTGSAMCVAVDWPEHEWFADNFLEVVGTHG